MIALTASSRRRKPDPQSLSPYRAVTLGTLLVLYYRRLPRKFRNGEIYLKGEHPIKDSEL